MCVVTMTDKDMETAKVSVERTDTGLHLVVELDGDILINTNYLYEIDYQTAGYNVNLYINYGGGQISKSEVHFDIQSTGYSFEAVATGLRYTHPIIAKHLLAATMNEPADRLTVSDREKNKYGQDMSAKISFVSSYVEEDDDTVQFI